MIKALKLKPALKETIWGGQSLKSTYENDGMDNIAEAWVLSCHRDGQSLVDTGPYKGLKLGEAIDKIGPSALGTKALPDEGLPILIKLIDAKEKLSVQVHPGDDYAGKYENDKGKTEAWLILECDEGAELIFGFKQDLSKDELEGHIKSGTLLDYVNTVKVKKGDVVYIPSGTLHAIGSGILLAEVQQNSNTTYRVFDYDRTDKAGNKRELHVKKAIDVLNAKALTPDFSPAGKKESFDGYDKSLLVDSDHFKMDLLQIKEKYSSFADETSFVSLLVLEGFGSLDLGTEKYDLKKGDSIFITANAGDFCVEGDINILETRI